MEAWLTPTTFDRVSVVSVVLLVGWLVWTGHLVPGRTHREMLKAARRDLEKAEERAERWETVALRSLKAAELLSEPVAVGASVIAGMTQED